MKLHHLSITGIGPYSGTETIDFEPLNEAGVHLLTGPTGSGKTTVLDAISYALFGQIPRSAKGAEVVSDHRKIDTRPQVVVDLTVGGSRLKVTRSPEHERPKARGEGTASEGQSVKLELHRDNEWHPLSDRWREANIELEERVGMNADQFSQVVMLPQGEFAKFLRSDARSRQELLEKLFPGNDLTFVENWLKSQAAEDGERRAAMNREIANSIERVRPIIDSAIENEVDGITEIPELAEAPPVISWIESTGRRLAELADSSEKARIVAAEASELSDRKLTEMTGRADLVKTRVAAEKELTELGARSQWRETLKEEIETADRAAAVLPLLKQATSLAATAKAATTRRDSLAVNLESDDGPGTSDARELPLILKTKQSEITTITNFENEGQPRRRQLAAQQTKLAAELESLADEHPDSPVVKARRALEAASSRLNEAKRQFIHVRDVRTRGIAAELAAGLIEGEPCAVCGSVEHPSPAHPEGDEFTKDDETRAEQAADAADAAERTATEAYQQARIQSESRRAELNSEISNVEKELANLSERETKLAGSSATIGEQREKLGKICETIDEFLAATVTATSDQEAAVKAEADARSEASARGFENIDQAVAAGRDPAALNQLKEQARQHDDKLSRLNGRIEGDLAGVDPKEEIDLSPLRAQAGVHREERDRLTGLAATAIERQQTFGAETGPIPAMFEQLAPLREAAARSAELSRLANGDNERRMRLSIYVLAARLKQVIHEANRHLEKMSDRRYELVYSGDLAGHGAASGLGIEVFDAYTSETRPTTTLSGGESFYASLSLALGLAEVVQQESGGRRLETLFIDEGFGTLDSETLDQVMNVIDSLREGGRAVGLVSHVEELRNRIPAQIQVSKSREGSSIETVGV
ncbi:MAG: SMC family ATPase [Solirubrobacterales bacterium]